MGLFNKKKKTFVKEYVPKPEFEVPEIKPIDDVEGLIIVPGQIKKKQYHGDTFKSGYTASAVKDEVISPNTRGLNSDIDKAYDAFRPDGEKKTDQSKYQEFKSQIISNDDVKKIFGYESLDVKKKHEPEKIEIKKDEVYEKIEEKEFSTKGLDFSNLEADLYSKLEEDKRNNQVDEINTANDDDFISKYQQEVDFFEDEATEFIDNLEEKYDYKDLHDEYDNNEENINETIEEPKEQIKPIVNKKVEEIVKKGADYSNYQYPPLTIFHKEPFDKHDKPEWIDDQISIINNTLQQFSIEGDVINFTKGPTVTRYEIRLKPGVNVKKVLGIEDNIKMNLAAKTIRIEAPIPGKPNLGIEVPNVSPTAVPFGNVLTEDFMSSKSLLTVAVGLNIDGEEVYVDIAKMPHGLVAGATGSGKSVCINTLLISLLLRNTPDDLKLMLVDPKMVELIAYNDLPHLVTPVINDAKIAAQGLKWAVEEMEKRYRMFADNRVRDIKSYNEKMAGTLNKKMPYIVIIIDELADLMMVASQDVEDAIQRLTQKSRAAGIHLIVATQRPTTDVVKGTIKANIPTRIAFKVSSYTDSTTILDCAGAELLLGKGDMLIKEGENNTRVQGAYISDSEIDKVTDFIRGEYDTDYLFTHDSLKQSSNNSANMDDELFEDVARFVVVNQTASINRVQKEFQVGFNRAQKLFEMLDAYGITGGGANGKAREVLITLSELESMLGE